MLRFNVFKNLFRSKKINIKKLKLKEIKLLILKEILVSVKENNVNLKKLIVKVK